MCLFVHPDAELEIAEHDIEVFKVLLKPNEDNRFNVYGEHKLFSPFKLFVYEVGQSGYMAHLNDDSKKVAQIIPYWPTYGGPDDLVPEVLANDMPEQVKDGQTAMVDVGIHTIASLEDARALTKADRACINREGYTPVVVRCIIPAGVKHFKGSWMFQLHYDEGGYNRMDSYTSAQLDIKEIVE